MSKMGSKKLTLLALAFCAIIGLQETSSSPLGRLKRAARVSVGVSVKVPPDFHHSRQFSWTPQDGIQEHGPEGAVNPVQPSQLEDLGREGLEEEMDIQPGGMTHYTQVSSSTPTPSSTTTPSSIEEDIQPGGWTPRPEPVHVSDEVDIQPGGQTPAPSRSSSIDESEVDIQPGGSTPELLRTSTDSDEVDIQPGGQIPPPAPVSIEEDILPGGQAPKPAVSSDENEIDIQPGGFTPRPEPEPVHVSDEEDIQPGGFSPPPPSSSREIPSGPEYIHGPFPASIEEDIQPGGQAPRPDSDEVDIQPGGQRPPPAPASSDEDIQPGPLETLVEEAASHLDAESDDTNVQVPKAHEDDETVAVTDGQPLLPEPALEAVADAGRIVETAGADAEPLATATKPESEVPPPPPPIEYEDIEEDIQDFRRKKRGADGDLALAFRTEARDQFNEYRDRVRMPQVTLDNELTTGAQSWADHMSSTGSTALSECDDCLYVETFAHKKLTGARRELPTGSEAADWVITRWLKKAVDNPNDPYSKALLRRENLSKMGIGVAYSRDGDHKEMFIVARFE